MRRNDGKSSVFDPKQLFFAIVGGVFGVGLLFLIGAHLSKSLEVSADTPADEALDLKPSTREEAPMVREKRGASQRDYEFFALLEEPAPQRDLPEVVLAVNPAIEAREARKKERLHKRHQARVAAAERAEAQKRRKPPAAEPTRVAAAEPTRVAAAEPPEPARDVARSPLLAAAPSALPTNAQRRVAPSKPRPEPRPLPAVTPDDRNPEAESVTRRKGQARFTVQVGAFQNRSVAEGLLHDLGSRGYKAHIKQETLANDRVMFRVRVGRFDSRDEARRYSAKMKSRHKVVGFPTEL